MPGRSRDVFVEPEQRVQARRRVLLVHADPDVRHGLAAVLVSEGMTVDEARSAQDAMAIVGYAPPDVVVYDLGWGAGLRQLDELARVVEELGSGVPSVVLLTPSWVRARRGITLRGSVATAELVSAVGRAMAARRSRSR